VAECDICQRLEAEFDRALRDYAETRGQLAMSDANSPVIRRRLTRAVNRALLGLDLMTSERERHLLMHSPEPAESVDA
jgi:hypothetical protein